MRLRHGIATLTVLAVVTSGCADSPPARPVGAAPPPTTVTPSVSPLTAKQVVAKLTAAKLGVTGAATQTEDTDPNNLLGRPNGYTERASASLPGGAKDTDRFGIDRGLVVEVWPSAAEADRRSQFIQTTLKSAPILGTEYHYRAGGGAILVRVSGRVKPSLAKKVEAALAGM